MSVHVYTSERTMTSSSSRLTNGSTHRRLLAFHVHKLKPRVSAAHPRGSRQTAHPPAGRFRLASRSRSRGADAAAGQFQGDRGLAEGARALRRRPSNRRHEEGRRRLRAPGPGSVKPLKLQLRSPLSQVPGGSANARAVSGRPDDVKDPPAPALPRRSRGRQTTRPRQHQAQRGALYDTMLQIQSTLDFRRIVSRLGVHPGGTRSHQR